MSKDIFFDKYLETILFLSLILLGVLFPEKIFSANTVGFIVGFFIIPRLVRKLIRTDVYVHNCSIDDECILFEYQQYFWDRQLHSISLPFSRIESFNFESSTKSTIFHTVSIRYQDEEGLYFKKSFNFEEDKPFIDLIYQLKYKL
jgi:hypothetical protein